MAKENNLENTEESPSSLNPIEMGSLEKKSPDYRKAQNKKATKSDNNLGINPEEKTDSKEKTDSTNNVPDLYDETQIELQKPESSNKLHGVYRFIRSLIQEIVTTLIVLKICTYFSR